MPPLLDPTHVRRLGDVISRQHLSLFRSWSLLTFVFEAKPGRYPRVGYTTSGLHNSSADVEPDEHTEVVTPVFIHFIAGSKIIRAAFIEVFVGEHTIVSMGN